MAFVYVGSRDEIAADLTFLDRCQGAKYYAMGRSHSVVLYRPKACPYPHHEDSRLQKT